MVTGGCRLQVTRHCDGHHKRIIVIHFGLSLLWYCNLVIVEWTQMYQPVV